MTTTNKIKKMNIKDYLDVLKTKAPAPGGGSVAGITAAQGTGLVLMVLDLTIGKEKYKQFENQHIEIQKNLSKLHEKFENAADNDRNAFLELSKAYKLPKTTDEEKKIKKEILSKASIGATEAPFKIIEMSYEAIVYTSELICNTNKMAISDLGVAAMCFVSAAKSAWLNVKTNLPYISDENIKKEFDKKGRAYVIKIEEMSKRIYTEVEDCL